MTSIYINALNILELQRNTILQKARDETDSGIKIRLTMERTIVDFKISRILKRVNA